MTTMFLTLTISSLMYMMLILKISNNKNKEKLYPFECGFNPMLNPQTPFSIQFFKILLIFLMFDMEIIIILPLPLFMYTKKLNMLMIFIILILLLMGLMFEWKEGSLQWNK